MHKHIYIMTLIPFTRQQYTEMKKKMIIELSLLKQSC